MPETPEEKAAREAREAANGNNGRRYLTAEEVSAQVTTMLARNGNDTQRTIAQLITDNRKTRDRLRDTRAELETLKAKAPAADAVVLTGEDKKTYEAFRALNLKPEDAKKRIDLAAKLESDQATATRNVALKETAKSLGYNEQVFVDLVNDKKLHVELRDGVVEGKAVKLPYIRPSADANAPLVLAKDFVAQQLAGYVPALTAKPAAGTNGTAAAGAGTGTTFPAQSGGTSTASPTPGTAADSSRNGNGTPAPAAPGGQRFVSPSERATALGRAGT